ncbi:MAG: CaiB/BaiF CoA-transferase family protein [Acidobacteria bacterium]|nr:CaiB/BaiF CoA-transferase family protein [Acidobacteriota bacterium]
MAKKAATVKAGASRKASKASAKRRVAKPARSLSPPKKKVAAKKAAPKKAASTKKVVAKRPAKKAAKAAAPEPKKVARKRAATSARPLDGLIVVEVGGGVEAAAAGSILAVFGATVLKIEPPLAGDAERTIEPLVGGVGADFLMFNRGKQSIALDAHSKKGRDAYLAIARKADIVIDGAGYGVLDRAGIGYKALSKVAGQLIYVAISGYGQSGPQAKTVGAEINHLAFAGVLELFGGASGLPSLPGLLLGPIAAGAFPAVIGTLMALQARNASGKGQLVDAAIVDGLMGVLATNLAQYSASKLKPRYGKGRFYGQYACYQLYPARGSHWVAVGALAPSSWATLCKLLKREDLIADQYADDVRQQVLIAELTRIFQRKEVRDWMEIFAGHDVCVTPLRGIAGAAHDEHLIERGTIVTLKGPEGPFSQLGVFPKLSATPGSLGREIPALGQHTASALEFAGLSKKDIDALLKAKVARVSK